MEKLQDFWRVTAVRGLWALLLSYGIFVVPEMARSLLLLPLAVVSVIVSLSVYGVGDSLLVLLASFFTGVRSTRVALQVQSISGLVFGVLLWSVLFAHARPFWFLYLIALQACATAYSEFVVARHTSRRHGSRWSFAAAAIAQMCGIGYAVVASMAPGSFSPKEIAVMAYGYLFAFGTAQVVISCSMLYLEGRAEGMASIKRHVSVPCP